jgi:filamentous hemagglutinin
MSLSLLLLVCRKHLCSFISSLEAVRLLRYKKNGKPIQSINVLAFFLLSIAYSCDVVSEQIITVAPPAHNALPVGGVINGDINGSIGNIQTLGNVMTVTQNNNNMIVNWGSFDIGKNATVNFIQPSLTSAVLNRVASDAGLSQIYGNLTANGQIFIINQNGILFGGGGGSVNVNSLIASTLNINDDLFKIGFLSITDGTAAFSPFAGSSDSFIQVNFDAKISSAIGGKVLMFAPNIVNNGLISTPDGQTLLAAGQKIYLAKSEDSNLRGLLVEVDNGGTTTNANLGQIIAERGNITLAGIAVNQAGRVKATTSVTANGSIKLLAHDNTAISLDPVKNVTTRFSTNSGEVFLGENSITQVLVDSTDKATVLDSAKVNKSTVDISAKSIYLDNNAMIIAPSGNVNFNARLDPSVSNLLTAEKPNASRIYFDSTSVIDVSGVGSGSLSLDRENEIAAKVSVSRNIVQAELRGTELRDSPQQRSGILYTAKVYVDARVEASDGMIGTSVADVSGYTSKIQKSINERFATGGGVSIQSEGDIVFAPSASINVSGGKIDFTGSVVNSTSLLASNGNVYDIGNAPKDLNYVDIQQRSYYEDGYTSGENAGSVVFSAPAMVLEGKLIADTVVGIYQQSIADRPHGGTLQIGQGLSKLQSDLLIDASHIAEVVPSYSDELTSDQKKALLLGANFTAPSGFNSLKYYADGQITLKNGTNLIVSPGGNITLNGGGVNVQSNLTVHSGVIDISASSGSISPNATGNVKISAASTLDASGLWINNILDPAAANTIAIDGGKINISASSQFGANGNIILETGSVLNASGGAWLNSTGKLKSGVGGDIKLLASDGITSNLDTLHSGSLKLDGILRADSLTAGGSLTLTSGSITIGTMALGTNGETVIDTALFRMGGFTLFDINGFEGLTLADNTIIEPAAVTRVLDRSFIFQQTGSDIASFSHLEMLPSSNAAITRKVTNLNLSATNQTNGRLTLGLGSMIITDPGANVNLLAKRQLTVFGGIEAQAGNISITSGLVIGEKSVLTYKNDQTLWLGAQSKLDVSGVVDSYTNANGFNLGNVKDAGSIKLIATKGMVVGEAGSQLELNGKQALLDIKSGNVFFSRTVASKGGSLSISAREGILFDGTMIARGGNESVAAGTLSITLPLLDIGNVNATNSDIENELEKYPTGSREVILKSTGSSVPVGLYAGDPINLSNNGLAYVFADKLNDAGFDNILLSKSDKIRFAESLTLKARGAITLDTPNLVVNDGVDALINASYVGVGNGQVLPLDKLDMHLMPVVAGTGALTINADYIDLFGQQNLSGIGRALKVTNADGEDSFIGGAQFKSNGDIQLRGVLQDLNDDRATIPVTTPVAKLQLVGDLILQAARIYPSTLSHYTISTTGTGSTIAFRAPKLPSSADAGVPFSVLGILNVEADNITQDGVLRAPFGVINLNATSTLALGNGSLTSVSAEGKTLPFGYTINGREWNFDQGSGRFAAVNTLPIQKINLDASSVNIADGSKIDISGGRKISDMIFESSDLSAWEFTTGTGGSDDVLASSEVFAVLPELKAGYLAGNSDSYINSTLKAGDSIYLSGGVGLAAGNYVLLPAHYALLPGGYSVKAVPGTQDFTAFQNTLANDGSMLVSGYRTQFGGITSDSRASGFVVTSGAITRTQSEFTDTLASNFFNAKTSEDQNKVLRLPADAGQISISALEKLVLDGTLLTMHSVSARGAEVNITSKKIAISGDDTKEDGYLTLSSDKLNAIGAESLTIGAKTAATSLGTQLDVISSNIKLIGLAKLTGQEITLVATDAVTIANGTSLNATGVNAKKSSTLIIGDSDKGVSGDGALIMVSSGFQSDIVRRNVSQSIGTLDIEAGATISASGSIIVDSTKNNNQPNEGIKGDIIVGVLGTDQKRVGGAVSLGASKISFGTITNSVDGLLLDNTKLAALGNPSYIKLKSYSTIDFYGTTKVGSDNLKTLTIESAGFKSSNFSSDIVTIEAETVNLNNSDSSIFDSTGAIGLGTLSVNALKEIGLGDGIFSIAGFSQVNLKVGQLVGQAKGSLDVSGDLAIDAGRITAAAFSKQIIKVSGNLVTLKHDALSSLDKAAVGGNLTLFANTITHGGIIDMPSGLVTLNAAGRMTLEQKNTVVDSLVLLEGSQINAYGSAKMLGTLPGLADGGIITLQTSEGGLRTSANATVDISAKDGAGAGKIVINTAGTATLAGTLSGMSSDKNGQAISGVLQGTFDLKASNLTDFSALNANLERGGFMEGRHIRVAQGDLIVAQADTLTAKNITLTTDDGNVIVAGKLNAAGSKGGMVKLNAGQLLGLGKGNITLTSTALIDASATNTASVAAGSEGDGGQVMLNTTSDIDTSPSNVSSRIIADLGSVIMLSGKGFGSDGNLILRAPRLGIKVDSPFGDGIAITKFDANVIGENASILAEGVKVYKNVEGDADITLDNIFIANMLQNNADFLASSDGIKSNLALSLDARFKVASGVEVRSIRDIKVSDGLDLHDEDFGGLALRANRDVIVNANISAGFTTASTNGELTSGGAWNYRITAGADLNSADLLATNYISAGNFTLGDGNLIRTGTGNIEIATGGNLNLTSATSAIYTAGELDNINYMESTGPFGATIVASTYNKNGGNIALISKGDINGADTVVPQLPANWLFRQGRFNAETGLYTKNTSWWTYFAGFKQNIGALGGGDISINAGGSINDLSAVIATNGRVFGSRPLSDVEKFADATLIVNGGGDLSLKAIGNVSGGLFMVDKGVGSIRVGGSLLADNAGINTAFALGDATLNVSSFGKLSLMTVFNPTLTGMDSVNVPGIRNERDNSSVFSTYGVNSSVQLTSIASGVEITNQLAANNLKVANGNDPLRLFPGTLKVLAMGGDLTLGGGGLTLMPSTQGSLQLAASGSINFNAAINMSDKDPAQLPSALKPISTQTFGVLLKSTLFTGTENTSIYHSASVLHKMDDMPVEIYAGKDIIGNGSYSLFLPKKTNVVALNDINNFAIFGQNINAFDVTSITAGKDFIVGGQGVSWGGAGYLNVSAGRNIDLNTSNGIVTRGNLDNPFLDDSGANLSLLIGGAAADDYGFISKYLTPSATNPYNSAMLSFVKNAKGLKPENELSVEEGWHFFGDMPLQLKKQFVQIAFFNELKQAGIEHNDINSLGFGNYKRGFDAISTYFPNNNYNGNLDLSFSQVKTERGGNLNVMAPGGSIVIGLPKIPETLLAEKSLNGQNADSRLGMFTVNGGNINLFSKDNIDVAQSRQFTIAGGDILNWSSEGDIDAGKGSKTATSAPPPLVRTDTKGNTVVDLSGVVSGSGIGTLQTVKNAPLGNVYLIAPSGTVDAGDAGVRSSGNLIVAAQAVANGANMQAGGSSSGVPAPSTANVSFSAPVSADSSNSSKQADRATEAASKSANRTASALPSLITVEVLSLGDEASTTSDSEKDEKKKAKKQQN